MDKPSRIRRETAILVGGGGLLLYAASLVYFNDRAGLYAFPLSWLVPLPGRPVFGVVAQWMPSFLHPFAFSLLTAAASPAALNRWYLVCSAWCALNIASELVQHPIVGKPLALALLAADRPGWAGQQLAKFVLHGTFDPGDILAAIFGSIVAALLMSLSLHWRSAKSAK